MFAAQQVWWIPGVVALALAMLVMALRPAERARARNMLAAAVLLVLIQAILVGVTHLSAEGGGSSIVGWINDIIHLALGAIVIRLAGMVLFLALLPLLRLNPPRIIEDLAVALVVLGWVAIWLRAAGVDLSSIVATSAVLTGIIVFSMQDTLGNIFGGLALQLDRSIRIGDWVRIDDLSGRVVEIRWRYTAIETRGRETVIVPNSALMKGRFAVIGARDAPALRWRRAMVFSLSSNQGARRMADVLVRAVCDAGIGNVAAEPPPTALLMALLPNGGDFMLRYWLTNPEFDDSTDSEVRMHCEAALKRAGIHIAMPAEERFVIKENESFRRARDAGEHHARIEALQKVDIFHSLSADELNELVAHLVHAPFVAGDVMTRQGAIAHWLYLIVKGVAEVWVAEENSGQKLVSTLKDGQVFGEMGMMTGEPRRATVIAQTDIDCYRLDKEGFRHILAARQDIAAEISGVLANRNLALAKHLAAAGNAATPRSKADVLARIREFFGLVEKP